MDCEVCGRKVDAAFVSLIEGAKMRTCASCAHMGRIISYPPRPGATSPSFGGASGSTNSGASLSFASKAKVEFDFVDDFAMIIRNARMKAHLPLPVLAEKINEKASFLERVEHGARPSETLARKLEKELNIKLLEEVSSETSAAVAAGGKKEVTLGDLIEIEMKKKKTNS